MDEKKFNDLTSSLSYFALDSVVHGSNDDLMKLLKKLRDYREFLDLVIAHVWSIVNERKV